MSGLNIFLILPLFLFDNIHLYIQIHYDGNLRTYFTTSFSNCDVLLKLPLIQLTTANDRDEKFKKNLFFSSLAITCLNVVLLKLITPLARMDKIKTKFLYKAQARAPATLSPPHRQDQYITIICGLSQSIMTIWINCSEIGTLQHEEIRYLLSMVSKCQLIHIPLY